MRNEPIIYDVTSVKYNKENEVFSHSLICVPRLNKIITDVFIILV